MLADKENAASDNEVHLLFIGHFIANVYFMRSILQVQ